MKRAIFGVVLLALATIAAIGLYESAAGERGYRQFLARGDEALRADQTFGAIEAYSGAIALRPDSMLAHLRRGEIYRRRAQAGDLDLAARDFRRAASLDPAATRPLEELGDVLFLLQRPAGAVEAYEQFVRLDDRSPQVAYKLALAQYRAGTIPRALDSLDRVLRLDDRLPDAYYLRGICLREQNRSADALAAFQRAVVLSPGLVAAREELADLYASLGRPTEELQQLQLLAGLDSEHVDRQVAVGLAHARAKRWELAVLTLGSALERTADDALYRALGEVWLESAQARNDRVDLSKAREALNTLVDDVATQKGTVADALDHATRLYALALTSVTD